MLTESVLWLPIRVERSRRRNHISRMTDRDHWIETLRCPRCLRVAPAKLSTAGGLSWKVRADDIPEGFKFIDGNFFCCSCERPVEL
jgi:hypothetical protein